MKNTLKAFVICTVILFSNVAFGQTYLGAFESQDLSIYAAKVVDGGSAELVRVENFMTGTDKVSSAAAVGAVYSQQYQQVLGVYANSEGNLVAHSVILVDNRPTTIKETFGTCKDPNYNAWFAVVVNEEDQLVAIRLTY